MSPAEAQEAGFAFLSRPRPRCLPWGLPPCARQIAPRRGALQKPGRNPAEPYPAAEAGRPPAQRKCPLGNAGLRTRIIRESAPRSGAATEEASAFPLEGGRLALRSRFGEAWAPGRRAQNENHPIWSSSTAPQLSSLAARGQHGISNIQGIR